MPDSRVLAALDRVEENLGGRIDRLGEKVDKLGERDNAHDLRLGGLEHRVGTIEADRAKVIVSYEHHRESTDNRLVDLEKWKASRTVAEADLPAQGRQIATWQGALWALGGALMAIGAMAGIARLFLH